MNKYVAYTMIGLAGILGGISLLAFLLFLFAGSLNLLDMHLDDFDVVWLNSGLSLLFFIQHSGMVRRPFRRWLACFVPEECVGAIYAIASGIVLFLVVLFWQTSTQTIVIISGIFRWFLRAVFFFCLLGFAWGAKALGFFDPFGLRPILNLLHGRNQGVMRLTVAGPYHLVRHPLYLFTIVIIWSCLDLTADRLLFNLLWTAWIVTASYFEERDLVAEFGNTYREYQKRVPMLILFLEWRKGNGQSGRKEANV